MIRGKSFYILFCLGLIVLMPSFVMAKAGEDALDLDAIIKQVESELADLRTKAVERQETIQSERTKLLEELEARTQTGETIEKELTEEKRLNHTLQNQLTEKKDRLAELEEERDEFLGVLKVKVTVLAERLAGTMVGYEREDLKKRADKLVQRLEQAKPDLVEATDELFALANEELSSGSEMSWFKGRVVDSGGNFVKANILRVGEIGNFCENGNAGILVRSEDGPNWRMISDRLGYFQRKRVKNFVAQATQGNTEIMALPLDVTGGLAIAERAFSRSFGEYVKAGGVVMIPLIAIAILGILIAGERLVTLTRVRLRSGKLTQEIDRLCQAGKYQEAEDLCSSSPSPVCRVLKAGLGHRASSKDVIENALEEAILHELPSLEKYLSLLAVLAVIAPFLGLLGTVTGMISTFNVITVYGTGDPGLLSGGISEALITTQIGLVIAIPLLLLHSLISGKVTRLSEEMETKATRLVNILSAGK